MSIPRPSVLLLFILGFVQPAVVHAAELTRAVAASSSTESPVSKVIELLGLLKRQLDEDGKADQAQHGRYTKWYTEQKGDTERVIKETSQKLSSLKSSIEQGEAFREGKQMELEKVAGQQAGAEAELKDASDRRQKERRTFEATEAELTTAADQFERALEVLAKKAPGGAAAAALLDSGASESGGAASGGPAAFLAVAKKLRSALEQDTDFALTELQRESLNGLVRLAAARAADAETATTQSAAAHEAAGGSQQQQLDFLQVRARRGGRGGSARVLAAGPFGEFDSQSGSVTQTLQSVLDKTQGQLDDARKDESKARDLFKKLKEDMEAEIKNKEEALADLKVAISRSQEEAGQLKSQQLAAQQLLKVTEEELAQLEADWGVKSQAFKSRTSKRDDEVLAVQDALELLSSDAAQNVLALVARPVSSAASLLQIGQSSHRQREAAAPGISLLALKMKTGRRSHRAIGSTDPFGKVKSMVRSMLRKLSEEQAQDQKHAAWCDSELAKSTKSKEDRETDVQKLKDRIEEMDAELAQLNDDIKNLNKDLHEMGKAAQAAVKLRKTEGDAASAALSQYRDAQKLIRSAIVVLQKFYNALEQKADDKGDDGFKANSMGSGVIGILEVAEADYQKLDEELDLSEKVAAKDFNEFMSESDVREAVFKKDLEYKNRAKVKLEGDLMRSGNDLKSYQKELEAVVSYLDELKSTCTIKGGSYDERQARREKELSSLREAVQYLNGEGMP